MESEEDELNIEDHKDRCRLCLKLFGESDVSYDMSEIVMERFGTITSIELFKHEDLSSMICVSCNRNLGKFISFRDDLIRKQQKLYNFVFGKDENTNEEEFEQFDKIIEDEQPVAEYLYEDTDIIVEAEQNESQEEQYIVEELVNDDLDKEEVSCESDYEYLVIPESSIQNDSGPSSRKILRPKAWNWTNEMELDLIRYRNKWKTEKTSDSSVFVKISKKFETKSYPKISAKSIKYKYEKLLLDPEKLLQLQSQAVSNPVDSDEELNVDIDSEFSRTSLKGFATKKTYSAWNQEKEVILLYHLSKIKHEQPAISDKQMLKILINEMNCEGFNNITEHIIQYHLKKLRQDSKKFEYLLTMAKELQTQREQESSLPTVAWSQSADAALLSYKKNLDNQIPSLKPSEIWQNISLHLELESHGSFTELHIKNRFKELMSNKELQAEMMDTTEDAEAKAESSGESRDEHKSRVKRRYLYWTDEMKESLFKNRNNLKKQVPARELWMSVAKQMEVDGFGKFTPQNVMYKYFNLKRQKLKPTTDDSSHQTSDVDED